MEEEGGELRLDEEKEKGSSDWTRRSDWTKRSWRRGGMIGTGGGEV